MVLGFQLLRIWQKVAKLSLFELFSKVTSKEGIKDIGASIEKNAEKISNYFSKMKATKGLENKVEIAGNIFALILNFNVY